MYESTLNLARILDRIPVIPDTSWARKCAVDSATCTKYALEHLKHRNDGSRPGLGWNEEGEAWMLGFEHLLDIPHLRRTYGKVLTLSEYFTLYDIDRSVFSYGGGWDSKAYNPPGLKTEVYAASDFNHDKDSVRVDRPVKVPVQVEEEDGAAEALSAEIVEEAMHGKQVWSMEQARLALEKLEVPMPEDDSAFISAMEKAGQAALYTFHDDLIMNKAVVFPIVEFTPRNITRPFLPELTTGKFAKADIIHLWGGVHDQRKAGALRFTTPEARQEFTDFVVQGVRPPKRYIDMANKLAARFSEKVGGRTWMGAHMRRGDMIKIGWTADASAVAHFNKTRAALAEGRETLKSHGITRLPLATDPFYLATDEEDVDALATYRSSGAILLSDLMTPADAKELGWESNFVDLLAFVEQELLANADFFVGSRISSTTGGILNMRMLREKPIWSFTLLHK